MAGLQGTGSATMNGLSIGQATVAMDISTGGGQSAAIVWGGWNQEYFTCQGTTVEYVTYQAGVVWSNWNVQMFDMGNGITNAVVVDSPRTREEQEVMQVESNRWQAEEKQKKERGRLALVSALERKQREAFEKEGMFELVVNDRLYRIRPGARVERLDKKTRKIQSYFCIHSSYAYPLPSEDIALGQKLLLESNEQEFLRIANETRAA
jgi:hypothetical protein